MKLPRKTIAMSIIVVLWLIASTTGVVFAEGSAPIGFKGTVKYIALEGGFWSILAEDGKNYDPINLAEEFKQDGLCVQVEAVVKERAGIHMVGPIIEITAISKAED